MQVIYISFFTFGLSRDFLQFSEVYISFSFRFLRPFETIQDKILQLEHVVE